MNESLFSKDFYPTPSEVIETVLQGLDLKDKIVLEPSAGSGNILSALKSLGAKTIACELNRDLAEITQKKCDVFLKNDFFKVDSSEVSHIDFIIANPPFSCAERHIQHMWNIAPGGCQIIALCNSETLNKDWSAGRKDLLKLIKDFGSSENLGNCFTDSERKTDVEVSLIRLFKPRSDSDAEFEGYFDLTEEHEHQENGLMQHSEIREIVSRYVGAVKMFNEVNDISCKINSLISPINSGSSISFGGFEGRNNSSYAITRDDFKKKLQKSAWHTVFNKLKMQKYVTKKVMENINSFVEKQENVPFTLINIYKMVELIVGTHGDRMQSVIVEAFDNITKYHAENRYGPDAWKTNDCFMVNRKFILPRLVEHSFSGGMSFRYTCSNPIDELTKALCFMTGQDYDKFSDVYSIKNKAFGQWFEFGFLRMKGYMKGSLHCEFLDEKVWEQFNIAAVKGKGWRLPSTTKHKYKTKGSEVEVY